MWSAALSITTALEIVWEVEISINLGRIIVFFLQSRNRENIGRIRIRNFVLNNVSAIVLHFCKRVSHCVASGMAIKMSLPRSMIITILKLIISCKYIQESISSKSIFLRQWWSALFYIFWCVAHIFYNLTSFNTFKACCWTFHFSLYVFSSPLTLLLY